MADTRSATEVCLLIFSYRTSLQAHNIHCHISRALYPYRCRTPTRCRSGLPGRAHRMQRMSSGGRHLFQMQLLLVEVIL